MAQAKLLGLIVDQQQVLTATATVQDLTGPIVEVRARLIEQLSERIGSAKAERIVGVLNGDESPN